MNELIYYSLVIHEKVYKNNKTNKQQSNIFFCSLNQKNKNRNLLDVV